MNVSAYIEAIQALRESIQHEKFFMSELSQANMSTELCEKRIKRLKKSIDYFENSLDVDFT